MNEADLADNARVSDVAPPRWKAMLAKSAARANVAEAGFLSLLRYSALAIAALVLVTSVVLLTLGAIQQFGPTRVNPEAVSVAADDVVPSSAAPAAMHAAGATTKLGIDQDVRAKTLAIYRSRFKAFQRPDTKITDEQVVDYVWSEQRIAKFGALGNGKLHNQDGQALSSRSSVMLYALGLVDTAARSDEFRKQLAAYRDAKKVSVCTDEMQTRVRTIDAWDSYSTSCYNWDISPIGCASTRTVEEPYVAKVCAMKFPDNLEVPAQQLASAVQRYADVADGKLKSAEFDAEERTARNFARKLGGQENISTSGKLFLGFLAVMFLYLFVALERHQRSLWAALANQAL